MWGSPHWPDVGRGKEAPIVSTKTLDSPICPGSGTFPDIVNNLVLDELTYVCATCGASVPNFELAPVHRHALPRAAVVTVRLDPPTVVSPTNEMDELCVIVK
jgi:hypothetical protein